MNFLFFVLVFKVIHECIVFANILLFFSDVPKQNLNQTESDEVFICNKYFDTPKKMCFFFVLKLMGFFYWYSNMYKQKTLFAISNSKLCSELIYCSIIFILVSSFFIIFFLCVSSCVLQVFFHFLALYIKEIQVKKMTKAPVL